MIVEQLSALAMRQGRLRRRRGDAKALVVHTTGAGPYKRHQADPERFPYPYEAAQHIYSHISPYCGHFLICGETGRISQLVPLTHVAWHVGSKGSWKYRLASWAKHKGFGWWFIRNRGLKGPRGLVDGRLWRKASANALTYGVEVSPPLAGPREPWSDAAWQTLRLLIRDLGIPCDRRHVFTHSDAHPLARSTKAGAPWDPSPRQWTMGEAARQLNLLK